MSEAATTGEAAGTTTYFDPHRESGPSFSDETTQDGIS